MTQVLEGENEERSDGGWPEDRLPRVRQAGRSPMYSPFVLLALLLPFLGLLAVGFGYPLINALTNSFTSGPEVAEPYRALLRDPIFWLVLRRTLQTAAYISFISLVIAYPTAELIHRAPRRIRPFLLALVVIPLWSSVIARTYGWVGIFQNGGVVDVVAGVFGAGPQRILYSQLAVVVGIVHVVLPLLILAIYAAVRNYDERLSLASLSLGVGRVRTMLRVKLPVLAPQIVAGTFAVFIISLGFFVTPALLGGPRSQLISNLISQQVFQRFDLARGQAMGVVLLVTALATLGLLLLGLRLTRRWVR